METSDDPVATPLLIASTVAETVSTIQQGRAAKAQGEFQADIAERNAQQALREAEAKSEAARARAAQRRREGEELASRQRAAYAKSGVEFRGSPLSTLIQTAEDTEADIFNILREGEIARQSDIFRAGTMRAEGASAKARGRAASRASVLSAVSTGMSGLASAKMAFTKTPKASSTKTPKTKSFDFSKHGGGQAIGRKFLDG